jgi:hypothetical protein
MGTWVAAVPGRPPYVCRCTHLRLSFLRPTLPHPLPHPSVDLSPAPPPPNSNRTVLPSPCGDCCFLGPMHPLASGVAPISFPLFLTHRPYPCAL